VTVIDEDGEAGGSAALTDELAESVSPVTAATEDGAAEDEGGGEADVRDIAAPPLADAGDAALEKFVEPEVVEGVFVPAKEPEGDIDFKMEEALARAKAAEKRNGGRGAARATADPEQVTTASGRKVDADALLAPLPRTVKRRLTPRSPRPLTDEDRTKIKEAMKVVRASSRQGATSYSRIQALKLLTPYDDPSVSRSLRSLMRDRDPDVRKALADVLAAHDNLESAKMLLTLISQRNAALGVSAAAALASLRDEKAVEWLYSSALTSTPSGAARAAVAEALGRIGEERSVPHLLNALSDKSGEVRAAAAIALGRFREAGAIKRLAVLTRDSTARVRTAALLALGSIRNPTVAGEVIKCLKDKDPAVRSAAARALGGLRVAKSVGPLVEALGREPSLVRGDIIRALTLITALRHDDNVLAWKSLVNGGGGMVADLALAASVLDEIEAGNVEYYGIRTYSMRICFVVDISGSMMGQKLEDAKEELRKAINRFTKKHFFNMIFFSDTPHAWRKRLTQATDAVLKRARVHIYTQNAESVTNIFDSVMLALKDRLVDTIFLLSDGAPTAGSITDPDAIRAAVLKANKRGVVIHCIGIGDHDGEFMAGLARDNNGKYVVPEEQVK
jgi:HEAT repeat protein